MLKEHIDINGVSLTIVDEEFKEKYENIIKKCQYHVEPLGDNTFLLLADLTQKKLFQAAGYNLSKIDFAVPQGWVNQPEIHKRFYEQHDPAVWSYENNQFGTPVWSSDAWTRMVDNVKAKIENKNENQQSSSTNTNLTIGVGA